MPVPLLSPRPQAHLLRAFFEALVQPGDLHEVRIPKVRQNGARRQWGVGSGYFDDLQAFVRELSTISGTEAEGIFITLNPVNSDLKARAANRLQYGKPITTADVDVVRRRALLIDVDAKRPAGISATEEEMKAALTVRDTILQALAELGWPAPLAVTASGNGGGLLYRLDLPNDEESLRLVEGVLQGLASTFNTDLVSVDTTVANAARLTKVIGSVAAKGDHLPERPHRLATATFNPDAAVVRVELLEAIAHLVPIGEEALPEDRGVLGTSAVRTRLEEEGIGWTEIRKGWCTVLRLDRCLTSEDHADGAAILAFPSGAFCYRCHHNSCTGKGWSDVRNLLIPPRSVLVSVGDDYGERDHPARGGAGTGQRIADGWPTLQPAALHGLAGDVVHALDPHTEADRAAVLVTFLVMFGNAAGRGPHVMAGEDRHGANLFAALVGETAKARKGSSQAGPRRLMGLADPAWASDRIQGGLSSGEGLIWAVRDEIVRTNLKGQLEVIDGGVEDKRLLAIEEEFASVLKVARRQGNTISETMRQAWDARGTLQSLTKNSAAKATNPHISILAHVTRDELTRTLTETDSANGLGNRFLWFAVQRSKCLPEPGRLSDEEAADLGARIAAALDFARQVGEVRRNGEASAAWRDVYPELSEGKPGLVGAMTARAEAQVVRLSLLYALLDQSPEITTDHLLAALAVREYAETSARYIFGDATGDPVAERILSRLRREGRLSRDAIRELFGRHQSAARLDQVLATLKQEGLVRDEREETTGRPRTIWHPVEPW